MSGMLLNPQIQPLLGDSSLFCHFSSMMCRSKANEIWNRVANLAVLAIPVLSIVSVDDEFVVHDIKIIKGQNGLFIAMPSRKMGEGDFRDIAHPLLSETRNKIKDAIFAEYEKLLSEKEEDDEAYTEAEC